MKLALLFALTVLSFTLRAEESEIWQDTFLTSRHDGYEEFSLGDIYLALPQQFFDLTYRERIEFLIRGSVRFDPDKKTIFVPGDGGQSSIQVRIITQTKEKLVLEVVTQHEDDKTNWLLERTSHGWRTTLKR